MEPFGLFFSIPNVTFSETVNMNVVKMYVNTEKKCFHFDSLYCR